MYYQMNTKNENFLEMSKLLKSRGVSNHKFMLRLDNRKLANLDPYDENLTNDQRIMIIDECRHNIWYFLREVIKVKGPDKTIYFRLNLSTCAFIWLYSLQVSSILHTPRQQFASLTLLALRCHTKRLSLYDAIYDEIDENLRIQFPQYITGADILNQYKINKKIRFIDNFEEGIYKEIVNNHKSVNDMYEIIEDTMISDIRECPIYVNTMICRNISEPGMRNIYAMIDYYNLPFKDYMYDVDPCFFDAIIVPIMVKYPVEDLMSQESIDILKQDLEYDEEAIESEIYMRRYNKKEEE